MSRTPFDPKFDELPEVLPIFPLAGVLLLPGGRLPLNIFEPRYLAMTRDSILGPRLIGLVQPCGDNQDQGAAEVYGTGCAGRMTAFSETEDGRYVLTLVGLIRFDIEREIEPKEGYRRVVPRYGRYRKDMKEDAGRIDRPKLLKVLGDYFKTSGIEGNWNAIEEASDERLVTSLAMICPFEAPEKQALLEAMTLSERARTITTIMEMASHNEGEADGGPPRH
ncbi:MAG: LON peptidase substrate-binding domain-containing protein [Kiloniellales bacterium]